MIEWRKKFGKFFKIGGIVILIIGVFLLIAPDSDNEPANATLITFIIALIFVSLGSVNAVAEIISMFFPLQKGILLFLLLLL